MRSPRDLQPKYPARLKSAATSITPHVNMNTDHGIPRLLPGPGDNAVASRKKTQVMTDEIFVKRILEPGLGVFESAISVKHPND